MNVMTKPITRRSVSSRGLGLFRKCLMALTCLSGLRSKGRSGRLRAAPPGFSGSAISSRTINKRLMQPLLLCAHAELAERFSLSLRSKNHHAIAPARLFSSTTSPGKAAPLGGQSATIDTIAWRPPTRRKSMVTSSGGGTLLNAAAHRPLIGHETAPSTSPAHRDLLRTGQGSAGNQHYC